jgi:hypothetical protein
MAVSGVNYQRDRRPVLQACLLSKKQVKDQCHSNKEGTDLDVIFFTTFPLQHMVMRKTIAMRVRITLPVASLPCSSIRQKIILGLPWLQKYNPEINWKEGTLQWRTTTMEEVLDKEEHLNRPTNALDKVLLEYLGMENELWINSKENLATKLASEANQKKPDLTPEQLVPQEYHDYLDIFDEDKANRFPDT